MNISGTSGMNFYMILDRNQTKEFILSAIESPTSSITVSLLILILKKLKIMLLVHAIKYHEARDWIRLQNQSTLTYQLLLAHCKLLEHRCEQSRNIKNNVLHPTSHLWSSHDSKPQQFLGYFIINIHHKTISKTLPVRFYVFQDTTNPPILLSYSASERLGIIEFKVSNEAPTKRQSRINYHYSGSFSNLISASRYSDHP